MTRRLSSLMIQFKLWLVKTFTPKVEGDMDEEALARTLSASYEVRRQTEQAQRELQRAGLMDRRHSQR